MRNGINELRRTNMKAFVYRTPTVTSIGGRDGSVRSADGLIDLQWRSLKRWVAGVGRRIRRS